MLKFSKHFKSIERSNYSSALKAVKLPTVVFVGDENAGKSSTLERFMMVDVLPRSNMICTRQPIVIKLRHAEDISSNRPDIRLKIPGQVEQAGLTESEAREAMERHMQNLAREGRGIVFEEEIEVEVRSDGVPTIDLIDLPGLVAVRVGGNEPDGISEMTERCTRHYLDKETTGVVVCVLDATMANLRTSRTLRLVQDARPNLKKIGVLAKADNTYDNNWEREGRSGPYWKLKDRLAGTAEDYVDIDGGYFALVNRNTMDRKTLPLQLHNNFEKDWFAENLPACQSSCLGIKSLVGKANKMMCEHLERTYVPGRLVELKAEARELSDQVTRLGPAPSKLGISRLLNYVERMLNRYLSADVADEICEKAKRFWPSGNETGPSKCNRLVARHRLAEEFARSLEGSSSVDFVAGAVADAVRQCFNTDTSSSSFWELLCEKRCFRKSSWQLCRFSKLRERVAQTVETYVRKRAQDFRKEALDTLQCCLKSSRGRILDTEDIRNALSDCLMWTLIVPVTAELTGRLEWFEQIRKSTVTMPEEDCAFERAVLEGKLKDIREAIDTLRKHF